MCKPRRVIGQVEVSASANGAGSGDIAPGEEARERECLAFQPP
jgi:hypothetical protein